MSSQDTVREQYRQRFSAGADYRDALWNVLCRDFFQKYVRSDERLLDLGCGWGEFSNNIVAARKHAMDLNPDAQQHLNPDVALILQDCSEAWPLEDDCLDTVFTSNFLEHLPDKASVERTVEQAVRCLRPGGKLIALGPNIRFLPGEYWDFWDHHVPITDRALVELLRMKGLEIDEHHPKFLPYTMSDGRNPSLALVKLYLRVPLAWRIMGRQFLIVARLRGKKGSAPGD